MNKLLILLSILLLTNCNPPSLSRSELVKAYYQAFDASEFSQITPLIQDTITIAEGDYVTPYSHQSFYEHFKWDSVFQTSYQIVDISEANESLLVTVASSSVRYKFLVNNPLTCQFSISFQDGKISRLDALDCPGANWDVWETERDSLVNWTRRHHPELDGFIYDLTMQGAINYMKAMEYYEKRDQS